MICITYKIKNDNWFPKASLKHRKIRVNPVSLHMMA